MPRAVGGHPDDAVLAAACRQGDLRAFQELFERYREPMFRLAYRFTNDAEDAEDATQQVFVRLFQKIETFRGEAAFSTWLYRLAVHVCLNARRGPRKPESLDALRLDPGGQAPDPAAAAERSDLNARIRAAIASLPDSLKAVFILVGEGDLSYGEAAETLGLSVEAVRMRMSRARRCLRERLKEVGIER